MDEKTFRRLSIALATITALTGVLMAVAMIAG